MNYKKLFINNVLFLINYFKFNHILIGHWIRAFHYNSPIYLFIFMCLLSKNFCKIMLLFYFIFIIFFFILFKGCWISSLENKLLKDNINICDIFLDFFNIKINNKNRFHFTLLIGFFYTLLLLFIYYIRFII
jgi:hypothetical protein